MSVVDVMSLDPGQVETLADMLVTSGDLARIEPEPEWTAERWRADGNGYRPTSG